MSFDLEGHGIVVTGAARGIGLAVSQRLAALGGRVSGWDLDCAPIQSNPSFLHRTVGPPGNGETRKTGAVM